MSDRSTRLSRGEEPFYRALGHLLRRARISARLTLDDLSHRVDQDRVSIWLTEHGIRAGSAQQYYDLATALKLGSGHVLRMASVIAADEKNPSVWKDFAPNEPHHRRHYASRTHTPSVL